MKEKLAQRINAMLDSSRDVLAGSVDENGYPQVKALFLRSRDGLRTLWFSTNTSSHHVSQWLSNPKACVYCFDPKGFLGLLLTGEAQVHTDQETKDRFWKPGDRLYYPKGRTDPDYCIVRFTAGQASVYHNLQKETFTLPPHSPLDKSIL